MTVWSSRYPDPGRLRSEAICLAECIRDQLLQTVPALEIRGIHLKGSAVKTWDSPLDYVPEISDVDVHVWFRDDLAWREYLGTVEKALDFQRGVEKRFSCRIPQPVHEPRPQLIVVNKMIAELEHFVHSPQSTVSVLFGEESPVPDYSDADAIRRYDAAALVEQGKWTGRMPLHLVDRPGRYVREGLRQLTFRVSPVCSRVLHISGVDTDASWSVNRTKGTAMLRDWGHGGLADSYSAYYLSAWEYFLSGYTDTEAGRSAIAAGSRALTEGAKLGRLWLEKDQRPAQTA